MNYRGWEIDYSGSRPVTGQWRAVQHGVSICAGDKESLQRMIDYKIHDRQEARRKREAEQA